MSATALGAYRAALAAGALYAGALHIAGGTREAFGGAIVFAALHGPTAPVIVFHGLLFGYVRLRTGSLWPSFLMHAVNNALALTGLYITLRGG